MMQHSCQRGCNEEKEDGAKKVLKEITAENVPSLERGLNLQIIREIHTCKPRRINAKTIIAKLLKMNDKEKNLESSPRKTTRYM